MMLWFPSASVEVTKNAVAAPLSVWVASVVPPSVKVTVPEGVPFDEVTTTLKVTGSPGCAGFSEEASVVVVCCIR